MATPIYQTVILGGGFTGLFTALHLSHQHYPRSVILIDQFARSPATSHSTTRSGKPSSVTHHGRCGWRTLWG